MTCAGDFSPMEHFPHFQDFHWKPYCLSTFYVLKGTQELPLQNSFQWKFWKFRFPVRCIPEFPEFPGISNHARNSDTVERLDTFDFGSASCADDIGSCMGGGCAHLASVGRTDWRTRAPRDAHVVSLPQRHPRSCARSEALKRASISGTAPGTFIAQAFDWLNEFEPTRDSKSPHTSGHPIGSKIVLRPATPGP